MSRSIVINVLLFQVGWFSCVLGGAYSKPLLGSVIVVAVIVYHLYQAKELKQEISLLIIALIIGFIFESLMTYMDLAVYTVGQFHPAIAPYWMILMWPLFATTLNLSMRWLKELSALFVAIIGGVFAPLAYLAGSKLGAVEYDNTVTSLSVIAFSWTALFPVLVVASSKLNGFKKTQDSVVNVEVARHV